MKNKIYAGIGSREITKEEEAIIKKISVFLKKNGYILRSGHAKGADRAFEIGANDENSEIYMPWNGFGQKPYKDDLGMPIIGKSIILINGSDVQIKASESLDIFHPNGKFITGPVRKLHERNFCQIMGLDNTPVDFVVCCANSDQDGEVLGGTGQAVRIAKHYKIPVINIRDKYWKDNLKNIVLTEAINQERL